MEKLVDKRVTVNERVEGCFRKKRKSLKMNVEKCYTYTYAPRCAVPVHRTCVLRHPLDVFTITASITSLVGLNKPPLCRCR
jgi:hypothetical protein